LEPEKDDVLQPGRVSGRQGTNDGALTNTSTSTIVQYNSSASSWSSKARKGKSAGRAIFWDFASIRDSLVMFATSGFKGGTYKRTRYNYYLQYVFGNLVFSSCNWKRNQVVANRVWHTQPRLLYNFSYSRNIQKLERNTKTIMATTFTTSRAFVALALLAGFCSAFAPVHQNGPSPSSLSMVPKFNGKAWEATKPEEGPSAGYGATKTLLLHGPIPFYNRVFKADDYEQAVLKYMAGEKCDRIEAQGNMDFYLANPNDWAFNRFEMQKRGTKYDYTTLEPKSLGLTLVWSTIVVFFLSNTVYVLGTGGGFWDFVK
jgi:hypothetical protein